MATQEKIRNIAIIAHVDHGKTTLVDELLKQGGIYRENQATVERVMDSGDLERERGITIFSSQAVLDWNDVHVMLLDAPGHVDFSYEVSRSLAACEGALLIVDATQGVEAQTLANVYLAIENNHEIVPALNKVDLPVFGRPAITTFIIVFFH